MRILLGTVDIAGQLSTYADGFRRLGHEVTTAISERNPYYPDVRYDVDVSTKGFRWSWKVNRASEVAQLLWHNFRHRILARHDTFVFLWGGKSLLDLNSEYPVLKKFGKRIVSIFNGDDVRHWSAYSQQMAPLIRENSCVALQDIDPTYQNDPLARPLRNVRMAESYSDLILSVPNQSALAVRPYMHFFVPLNLREYENFVPGREAPVVVHAPTHKGVKGTADILAALERLRSEGVAFELRLLHGVSNTQVRSALAEADLVIDQLHLPLHGKLGVEAMASGCALATCDRQEYEPFPPNRPIWHIGPENLYQQLKRLLRDKELRARLAREGRGYAEQHHDHVKVAGRIVEHLNAGAPERYDHHPTFFARHYRPPAGTNIPESLKDMTARIVQRWGLPEGVDPQDLIQRGLMSEGGLDTSKSMPRWGAPSGGSWVGGGSATGCSGR